MYVSKTGMTLDEFWFACDACCKQRHNQSKCLNCSRMMYAAKIVQEAAVCSLSALFREAFRGVKYTSESAKQRFLRMPVACVRVGESLSGTSQLLIMESVPGDNYQKVKENFSKSISDIKPSLPTLTKQEVKGLLELAESDRERECIRGTIHKAPGLSQSGSRKHFGFEQMTKRAAKADDCIKESLEIRRACHQLAEIQVQALSITSKD